MPTSSSRKNSLVLDEGCQAHYSQYTIKIIGAPYGMGPKPGVRPPNSVLLQKESKDLPQAAN